MKDEQNYLYSFFSEWKKMHMKYDVVMGEWLYRTCRGNPPRIFKEFVYL